MNIPKLPIDHYQTCQCGNEVIALSKWEDESEMYLTVYKHEHFKPSIWARVKYIWMVLTKGQYYADQAVLSKEQALEIMNYIKLLYQDEE